jgi:hypothetical protein
MSVGGSLRRALRDFYENSWRLLALNFALTGFVVAVLGAGLWFPPALVLLVLVGPLAAGLMHCALTVAATDELALGDAVAGVRLHWRRGLVLGVLVLVVGGATAFAVPFYVGLGGVGWPLAIVSLYVAVAFGALQLILWPLAILERDRSLGDVARESLGGFLRRPAALSLLAFALLVVNVVGLAAAVVPFLTLTVAYSFLAAAHFALPRPDSGGAAWQA